MCTLLGCPYCDGQLKLVDASVLCPSCKRSWPIESGIPRFFRAEPYWGEISQQDARSLLRKVEQTGWKAAVEERFRSQPEMLVSLLDWQRISWLPLLGLTENTVALDVGSGYGAITHSLSQFVGEVYSVEAVTERIEFTRIRLKQEGIENVHLIQGTALELPFSENSFDLIVVNGVLEWVGEWRTEIDPRSVQVDFLKRVARLLYTSLMPRKLAGWYLRHKLKEHYRTRLNSKREYRTYTYTRRGYQKLLFDAGFQSTYLYWAVPGYNQPYTLVPLESGLVSEHIRERSVSDYPDSKLGWRTGIKRWMTRHAVRVCPKILPEFVSDFLIFAQKESNPYFPFGQRVLSKYFQTLEQNHSVSTEATATLSTGPFYKGSVLSVYRRSGETFDFVLKCFGPSVSSRELMEKEVLNLSLVSQRMEQFSNTLFEIPRSLGCTQVGSCLYSAESRANGIRLSEFIFLLPRKKQWDAVKNELPRYFKVATQLANILKAEQRFERVDSGWWQIPDELSSDAQLQDTLSFSPRGSSQPLSEYRDWIQHGDFTSENIFGASGTGKLSVIDWKDVIRGVPPLYDLFSLIISVLPAVTTKGEQELGKDRWIPTREFLMAFFSQNPYSEFFRTLLVASCEQLSLPSSEIWRMFVASLVIRFHYYRARNSGTADQYLEYLKLASKHARDSIFVDHAIHNSD